MPWPIQNTVVQSIKLQGRRCGTGWPPPNMHYLWIGILEGGQPVPHLLHCSIIDWTTVLCIGLDHGLLFRQRARRKNNSAAMLRARKMKLSPNVTFFEDFKMQTYFGVVWLVVNGLIFLVVEVALMHCTGASPSSIVGVFIPSLMREGSTYYLM